MKTILDQFGICPDKVSLIPLKTGHINDSYKVEIDFVPRYFLQKINHHIFQDVVALQKNISMVTDHLRAKLLGEGVTDVSRQVLQLLPTRSGEWFFKDAGGAYWRMYHYISDAFSYDAITPDLAYKAGRAFGVFQNRLADISPARIVPSIPNFHRMSFRLEEFRTAVSRDAAGRLSETRWMVDELLQRVTEMEQPDQLMLEGKLPKRICHCDTKVNNILFDNDGNVLCVVDLDTVMPNTVLSDYGDFMRTSANKGAEDDSDLIRIGIDFDIVKAYTQGYLQTAAFLTPVELEWLPFGTKWLTYMQTVRFYTDYLNGDKYYKIQSEQHNWQRTLAQFQLLREQEKHFIQLQQIVRQACDE